MRVPGSHRPQAAGPPPPLRGAGARQLGSWLPGHRMGTRSQLPQPPASATRGCGVRCWPEPLSRTPRLCQLRPRQGRAPAGTARGRAAHGSGGRGTVVPGEPAGTGRRPVAPRGAAVLVRQGPALRAARAVAPVRSTRYRLLAELQPYRGRGYGPRWEGQPVAPTGGGGRQRARQQGVAARPAHPPAHRGGTARHV